MRTFRLKRRNIEPSSLGVALGIYSYLIKAVLRPVANRTELLKNNCGVRHSSSLSQVKFYTTMNDQLCTVCTTTRYQ